MATCQCPVCYSLVIGEPHIPVVCSNCNNQFVFPTGFQAKLAYIKKTKRKCDCGQLLKFVKMVGGLFHYECEACGFEMDFF